MDRYFEEEIYKKIKNYFKEKKLELFDIKIISENNEINRLGDALLYYQNSIIGLIEVKRIKSLKSVKKRQIKKWAKLSSNYDFYILISENESILFNKFLFEVESFQKNSMSIFNEIEKLLNNININSNNTDIINIIREHFTEYYDDFFEYNKIFGNINDFEVDNTKKELKFSTDIEMKLMDYLLKSPQIGSKVYRYTSLKSAFMNIDEETVVLSGIVGMNDTSEVDYVENYLYGINIDDHKKHWQTINKLNNKYIMSCTTLEDDLTFWRLYGDDFAGASLEMEIIDNYCQNEKKINFLNYVMKHVHYSNENGKDSILEVLKSLINVIHNKTGLTLIFRDIDTWKHFFKPFEYSVENEIRVLYKGNIVDDRRWNLTYTHNILNPFVIIKMDEIPLKLTALYLGKKSSSFSTNEYQFKQLIRERNLHNQVKVFISKISNYR